MTQNNNYTSLLEETRKIYTKSIIREHISNELAKTLLLVESRLKRELTREEIEDIFVLLTDDENNI